MNYSWFIGVINYPVEFVLHRTLYFHEYSLAVQFKSNFKCYIFQYCHLYLTFAFMKKIHESEIGLIRADFISLIPNVVSLNYGLFYNDVQSMGSSHSLNFVTISCDRAVFKKKIIYQLCTNFILLISIPCSYTLFLRAYYRI